MRSAKLVIVGLLAQSFAWAADQDELITKLCSEGVRWSLPKVQAPFSVSEVYLGLNGNPNKTMRICHCTEDVGGNTVYVWVRAQQTPAPPPTESALQKLAGAFDGGSNVVSLLRGRGCLDVRGENIAVHHSDKQERRWGTYVNPAE
jgi:hypothetical protein